MLFNSRNRALSIGDKNNKTNDFKHVEVLSAKSKKEKSEIEERFEEPIKELSKAKKELDSLGKELKRRIRDVRKRGEDNFEFEKDMYQTRAGVIDSKIKAVDKQGRMIKDMKNLEIKDKRLQQDTGQTASTGNNIDRRGQYADFFSNNNQSKLNGGMLANPERNNGMSQQHTNQQPQTSNQQAQQRPNNVPQPNQQAQQQPKNQGNNQQNMEKNNNHQPQKQVQDHEQNTTQQNNKDSNVDYDHLENTYGINYDQSRANLKHRDEELKEVVHVDPDKDVFWLEVYDEDDNKVDKSVRRKHIETLGDIQVDKSEGVVMDDFNNTYEYEIDDAENMNSYYREQWERKNKL